MLCYECGQKMRKKKGEHHYTESGLDNVYLKNIPLYTCACGEETVEIPHIEELHRVIAFALIHKKTLLNAGEIKYLRHEMELRAVDLAEMMGVNKVSVSRWESGTQEISKSYDRMLRLLYIRRLEEENKKLCPDPIINELKDIEPVHMPPLPINIPMNKLHELRV